MSSEIGGVVPKGYSSVFFLAENHQVLIFWLNFQNQHKSNVFFIFSAPQAENFRNKRHHFINLYQYSVCFFSCLSIVLLQSNTNHHERKKNMKKKKTKSYIVLKHPKMLFLGEQKIPDEESPPLKSPTFDLTGGLSQSEFP